MLYSANLNESIIFWSVNYNFMKSYKLLPLFSILEEWLVMNLWWHEIITHTKRLGGNWANSQVTNTL